MSLFMGKMLLDNIGGRSIEPCLCVALLIGQNWNFFYFELKRLVFVMTKTVSNRDICFIKTVLLLCKRGHFFLNFVSQGPNDPPPILLGLTEYSKTNASLELELGKTFEYKIQFLTLFINLNHFNAFNSVFVIICTFVLCRLLSENYQLNTNHIGAGAY